MTRLDTTLAVCRTMDPEAFHPVGDDWSGPAEAPRIARAKAACAGCPIRSACLADGIARGDAWSILGGTLPDERRVDAPRKREPVTAPPPRPAIVGSGRLREQPTPLQADAMLVAMAEPGGYVPGSVTGSITVSLRRDGLAERVEPRIGRRSTRLSEHGWTVARRLLAEQDAAIGVELDALAEPERVPA